MIDSLNGKVIAIAGADKLIKQFGMVQTEVTAWGRFVICLARNPRQVANLPHGSYGVGQVCNLPGPESPAGCKPAPLGLTRVQCRGSSQ